MINIHNVYSIPANIYRNYKMLHKLLFHIFGMFFSLLYIYTGLCILHDATLSILLTKEGCHYEIPNYRLNLTSHIPIRNIIRYSYFK